MASLVQPLCLAVIGLVATYFVQADRSSSEITSADLEPTVHGHDDCPIPKGARWCDVSESSDYGAFKMAVYPDHDIVGSTICQQGRWDSVPFSTIEAKTPASARTMIDIGANAGWYSVLFALRGWKVESFEPMPMNTELLEATMCRNPELKKHISIHKVALGSVDKKHVCGAYSSKNNIGDATICCPGEPCGGPKHVDTNPAFEHRGDFHVRSLDGMLANELPLKAGSVGFVKIDIEGYECDMLMGANTLLQDVRPLMVKSEVNTYHSNACPPKEYLHKYVDKGYDVRLETADATEFDFDGPDIKPNTADNYWMQLQGNTEVQQRKSREVHVHGTSTVKEGVSRSPGLLVHKPL